MACFRIWNASERPKDHVGQLSIVPAPELVQPTPRPTRSDSKLNVRRRRGMEPMIYPKHSHRDGEWVGTNEKQNIKQKLLKVRHRAF